MAVSTRMLHSFHSVCLRLCHIRTSIQAAHRSVQSFDTKGRTTLQPVIRPCVNKRRIRSVGIVRREWNILRRDPRSSSIDTFHSNLNG